MTQLRARVDLRSLICLAKTEYAVGDRCRVVATGAHSDGTRIRTVWPAVREDGAVDWPTVRKHDWVFQGDDEALHLWEGDLAEGESVVMNVLLLRPTGPEGHSDADLVRGFAEGTETVLPTLLGAAGTFLGKGKLGTFLGSALGNALASMVVAVLKSDAVNSALSVEGERELGSFSTWVAVHDGKLVTGVGLGPGVKRDGWRRLGVVQYPSPSKSGKTLRLVMSRSGAKYGAELQVRDVTVLTPALPNGVCHIWTGMEVAGPPTASSDTASTDEPDAV